MQPFNLQLYVINYHLQLCFVIFRTNHHPFQFINLVTKVVPTWLFLYDVLISLK
jgi:hypothetical protein